MPTTPLAATHPQAPELAGHAPGKEKASFDVGSMREAAGEACALLRALSNPDRLLILCLLVQGERTVGALEHALGILQPTLSQQLAVLRAQRLVETRRAARHIHYRLAPSPAALILEVLHAAYCANAPQAAAASSGPQTGTTLKDLQA